MKKLLMIMLCMILLVGTVSAWEWDNTKKYNETTQEVLVENSFGFGEDIATIKLTTPLNNKVPIGYKKVAEMDVHLFYNYTEGMFDGMDLYDASTDHLGRIYRDFDYRYKTEVEVPIEICTPYIPLNTTNCSIVNQTRERWILIEDELLTGNYTIGIFTNVQKEDVVEWIPTFFGVRIPEWAVWTAAFDVDNQYYYQFKQGGLNEISGASNLSTVGTPVNSTGIINYAYNYTSLTSDKYENSSAISLLTSTTDTFTVNFWYKGALEDTNNQYAFYMGDGYMNMHIFGYGAGIRYRLYGTGPNDYNYARASDSDWHMISLVYNGSQKTMYFDGTNIANQTTGTLGASQSRGIAIGNYYTGNYGSGTLVDEVGIWNRTMTPTEISDLWNTGLGLKYQGAGLVTLLYPQDNHKFFVNTIELSCNTSANSIKNVSLILDGVNNGTNTAVLGNTTAIVNFTITLSDGSYNWTCLMYDTLNNSYAAPIRNFIIDTGKPFVNVTFPKGLIDLGYENKNETLNWTAFDANGLHTCWYEYLGSEITNTTYNDANWYYKMDNYTGVVYDMKRNFDGTNNGATRGQSGILNNSILFGANDVYVSTGDNRAMNGKNISISAWIYHNGIPPAGQETILSRFSGIQKNWQIGIDTDGTLFFNTYSGCTSGSTKLSSNITIADTTWTYVTFVLNHGVDKRIYINDTLVGVSAVVPTIPGGCPLTSTIGWNTHPTNPTEFDGRIDEISFWNRTLSPAEISQLYNSGSAYSYRAQATRYGLVNTTVTCSANTTTFQLQDRWFNLTFWANDTLGNLANNFTSWNYRIFENYQTFNSTVFETSQETFRINATYDSSSYTSIVANLVYNGTKYPGTNIGSGDNILFTRTIQIPEIGPKTQQFWWEFVLTGSSYTINSTFQSQSITAFDLHICDANYTTPALNFTIKEEGTFNPLNASMEAEFEYWISGAPITTKTYNFQDLTDGNVNYSFCISPSDVNLKTNAIVSYFKTGYDRREYYLTNAELSNDTQNIDLYLAATNATSIFTFLVLDENENPVEDAQIRIQRWDIGTGIFYTVNMIETDQEGKASTNLRLNDAWYRYQVLYEGDLKLQTNPVKETTTSRTLRIVLGSGDPYYDYDFGSLAHLLTFNNATNTFTFTYADTTGGVVLGCLKIWLVGAMQNEIENNECVSSTSATLSYIATENGTYIAQGIVQLSSNYSNIQQIVDELTVVIGKANRFQIIDSFGQVISLVLIGTSAMLGVAAGSIILGTLLIFGSLILVNLLGWLYFTDTVLYGLISILILIVMLSKRSGR